LIIKPKYPHRKKIKKILRSSIPNQFNDEVGKKSIKKITQKIT
jgi:hypothetical protein